MMSISSFLNHHQRLMPLVFCSLVFFGCGGDDEEPEPGSNNTSGNNTGGSNNNANNGGGGGNVTCTVTATATPDSGARTINGIGRVECDGTAQLSAETCVQWNPSGAFEDIQCRNASQGGVMELEVANLSSCGLGGGRSFRVRVNASVDGTAQAEVLSSEVSCN